MKYSRLATSDDFKGYEIEFDHTRSMSNNVKMLLEDGKFNEGKLQLRKETGLGFMDSKIYCNEYQSYLNAKKDFENGKPVYISY